MRLIFWLSLVIVAYVYVGYPALLALVRRPRRVPSLAQELPRVSLLIAAYNEEAVLREKLENSLALDYPRELLEIVVASDGSDDGTNEIAREFAERGVVLHEVRPRGGKTRALNTVAPLVRGDIIVLSDANTMYRPDAVKKLIRHFADPRVGGVSGDVRIVESAAAYAQSEGLYYRYERFIQEQESRLGAIVGADGAMYAIRRETFRPVPPEVVVDDFVISMTVARLGYQLLYDREAIAIEQGTLSSAEEFRRKIRVVAGGIQALKLGVGLPRWSQPTLLWCYVSHKLLRWLVPAFLCSLLFSSLVLAADSGAYALMFLAQVAFYSAAALHARSVHAGRSPSLTVVPYYFCLVNVAALRGLLRGLQGGQRAAWNRTRRTEQSA
jgi:cellulose synthase/poly-beta-1,6-N-acetylglucosamine synthase-like glycosyltransferase